MHTNKCLIPKVPSAVEFLNPHKVLFSHQQLQDLQALNKDSNQDNLTSPINPSNSKPNLKTLTGAINV